MLINHVEVAEKFAKLWRTSRENAEKSQDYMAKALGVSKKTVQNWENGTASPSQRIGFLWFKVLGVQPLPYFLKLLYPEFEELESNEDENAINMALMALLKDMPLHSKKELLYMIDGEHGSSAPALLEMVTAHLQTPMRDRLNIAQSILTNYDIAAATGRIRHPDQIQPNIGILREAVTEAEKSIKTGKESYTII